MIDVPQSLYPGRGYPEIVFRPKASTGYAFIHWLNKEPSILSGAGNLKRIRVILIFARFTSINNTGYLVFLRTCPFSHIFYLSLLEGHDHVQYIKSKVQSCLSFMLSSKRNGTIACTARDF
ncbi:hypothetical protein SARC_10208 [Sphaeroforma arctica JP610]|uniref:Uncharacterized protein n=1 Tax=Sphaeroforma arctica JP610 TaxID=667725 RepID=A0A0L0FMR4_9EUKA|nr:hypothetical protein SARC_10208 [Sphaeroforma arctica JP610]KNC77328.1 hypothetical protein SARC_10208 [Sphaeroforma arctica JP610]|eukprot:XP_014151230.1 hypothetical protein SARC_10208 [Sphaeroforma arctica JP610]